MTYRYPIRPDGLYATELVQYDSGVVLTIRDSGITSGCVVRLTAANTRLSYTVTDVDVEDGESITFEVPDALLEQHHDLVGVIFEQTTEDDGTTVAGEPIVSFKVPIIARPEAVAGGGNTGSGSSGSGGGGGAGGGGSGGSSDEDSESGSDEDSESGSGDEDEEGSDEVVMYYTLTITATADETVELCLISDSTLTVDWGDGETGSYTSTSASLETHTYAEDAEYVIAVSGPSSGTVKINAHLNKASTGANSSYQPTIDECTLTSADIICNVTSIGSYAFYLCTSLESITIGDSVTSIGSYAFYLCTSLESVTIGGGVTSIGSYAFYHCTSLESITIPESVTSISGQAFRNCTSLTSVTIENADCSISSTAFTGCTSLETITLGGTEVDADDYK